MAKGTRRKPGLWFSAMKVEVEEATTRQKKPCCDCGNKPAFRRLVVVRGAGRHSTTEIRCIECGCNWLRLRELEARRAQAYILTGNGEIRK